jgi:transcriptional regulator with XRE-family HTH domain
MVIWDHMLAAKLGSPSEAARGLAERARARRLDANLSQEGLATRAGISLGSLKRFERTGEISLDRLLRIAFGLGASDGFDQLFAPRDPRSLDELITEPPVRQRGRRR